MNKSLVEKIIREKLDFETDYGTMSRVDKISFVDDESLDFDIVEVFFNRLNFIDIEKVNQLAASFGSFKTQIAAMENEALCVIFYCERNNTDQV